MTPSNPCQPMPRQHSQTPSTPSIREGVGVGVVTQTPSTGSTLDQLFAAMAGRHIPGGCDDCNAWQEMTRHGRVYVLTVHHDDTCPTWRRHQAITRREAAS